MTELPLTATKLLLATLAFVVIGWLGARDKRIGGVLLTFPLLNGIAMLTGADPLGIAATVYLVVMWNCALFLIATYTYDYLPPLPARWDQEAKLIARAVCWAALWAAGATLLTLLRDALSSAASLLLIQFILAALYVWLMWRAPEPVSFPTFREMWFNWRGGVRAVCFVAAFLLLLATARLGLDARWIGWASALPLPGIFALAMLSVTQTKDDLLALGDTVLLGPLLAIPFNWLLSRAIIWLRIEGAGPASEIAIVVFSWLTAAAIVWYAVPPFARWRDRVARRESKSPS